MYTYQCTQADGTTYTARMRGFNRNAAAKAMREDKAVFTGCKNWRLIKVEG